jgi:hypothetical protein
VTRSTYKEHINTIKQHKERGLTPSNVLGLKKDIKKFNLIIKELKTHARELKKHI